MREKWLPMVWTVIVLVALIGVIPAGAAPEEDSIIHVVQRGETLYSIARRYGVNVWSLAHANGITNPNLIYVGQRIVVPSGQSTGGTIHVVRPGETMLQIALRYGMDAWAIARANGITNLNYIYVGQRLVIPGTSSPAPAPTSAPRPTGPTSWPGPWSAEYFDNITLTDPVYLTREDEAINFNWNSGPPAGGMPVNAFSVRWTGDFAFDEGTYRFYARVDDGVRLYVDDELVINGWRDGGYRLYYKDVALTDGEHTVQVEYYDRIQVARIYVWWKMMSSAAPTATPAPDATATPKPSSAAWLGEYFNNEDLEGDPVVTEQVPSIGFDWGTDSPKADIWRDGFSARWTREVYLKQDHYRFCARSDDGVRIWVDDTLVVDGWRASNGSVNFCDVYWAATGTYDIKVEYYEHGGNALIYVWWEPH